MGSLEEVVSLDARALHALEDGKKNSQVVVVLQNFPHLCEAYGVSVAETVKAELRHRLSSWEWGGVIAETPGNVFIISLSIDPAGAHEGVIEGLLLKLVSNPVGCGPVKVFPAVTVELASVGSIREKLEAISRRGRARSISSISPIQSDYKGTSHFRWPARPGIEVPRLPWREEYRRNMAVAVEFFWHLQCGRVFLVHQPVKELNEEKPDLYRECLMRVATIAGQSERQTMEYIQALECLGLVRFLDYCIVNTVIEQLSRDRSARLGCNISAQSAVPDVWWNSVFSKLKNDPEVASRLTVEVTESALPSSKSFFIDFVERLRGLRCRVAADDFGTGFNNLEFALAAKFDIVKIDRHFLEVARQGRAGSSLLSSMIQLCGNLAPWVVVEGLERADDLMLFQCLDRRLWGQGFFLGRPSESISVRMRG